MKFSHLLKMRPDLGDDKRELSLLDHGAIDGDPFAERYKMRMISILPMWRYLML